VTWEPPTVLPPSRLSFSLLLLLPSKQRQSFGPLLISLYSSPSMPQMTPVVFKSAGACWSQPSEVTS
jgi:hypothetical protein